MKIFAQLTKFDPFQGLAYGTIAAQKKDHSGETMDYEKSKPHFLTWSSHFEKASNGAGHGNVCIQHDRKKLVGSLVKIDFNDADKKIDVVAKIVDPVAKDLLKYGALTGFSIGGSYAEKVTKSDGVWYTARPQEVSVVDRPCLADARFSLVKSESGEEELMKFADQVTADELIAKYFPKQSVITKLEELLSDLKKIDVPATPNNDEVKTIGEGQLPGSDQEYCDCATGQAPDGVDGKCPGCGKKVMVKQLPNNNSEGTDPMKKCEGGKCGKCEDCMSKAAPATRSDYESLLGKVAEIATAVADLKKSSSQETKVSEKDKELAKAKAKVAGEFQKVIDIVEGLKKAVTMTEGGTPEDTELPDGGAPYTKDAAGGGGVKDTVAMQVTKMTAQLAELTKKMKGGKQSADSGSSDSSASDFGKALTDEQLGTAVENALAKALGIETPKEPKTFEDRVVAAVTKSLEQLGVPLRKSATPQQPYLNTSVLAKSKSERKTELEPLAKAVASGDQEAMTKMFGSLNRA